jgi:hypothetical protein
MRAHASLTATGSSPSRASSSKTSRTSRAREFGRPRGIGSVRACTFCATCSVKARQGTGRGRASPRSCRAIGRTVSVWLSIRAEARSTSTVDQGRPRYCRLTSSECAPLSNARASPRRRSVKSPNPTMSARSNTGRSCFGSTQRPTSRSRVARAAKPRRNSMATPPSTKKSGMTPCATASASVSHKTAKPTSRRKRAGVVPSSSARRWMRRSRFRARVAGLFGTIWF